MKRVGIITHYYNSTNYGGLLQAYALCDFLNSIDGIEAEQVQYNSLKYEGGRFRSIIHDLHVLSLNVGKSIEIKQRERSCDVFRKGIRHSSKVYTHKTIQKANDDYDAFIVGSDQVWNPGVFNAGYSLAFSTKPKYAFSASIAADEIPVDLFDKYKTCISDCRLISVRERKAQELLFFRDGIALTLDPVFLKNANEWSNIASPRKIEEKYIFTYFLGDDLCARDTAERLASTYSFKIVNIPYLLGKKRSCDKDFGDIIENNVSPNDFLSLILNAEIVLTDSFHVICFSLIFKKDFYVFKRGSGEHMNSRIVDILNTFDLEDRYVDDLEEISGIDYEAPFERYNLLYADTLSYIEEMIREIKEL